MASIRHRLACGGALGVLICATAVQAQPAPATAAQTPAPAEAEGTTDALPLASQDSAEAETVETEVEAITVVGSQIRGARVNTALPVRVVDEAEIVATGAVSGDELFRSIPQMGDVLFSAANNPQTSNAARGDVNSINLRSLGVGNTLVLLNGRRLVQHAASQGTSDTGLVPVLTFNSNSIPVSGVERLEVLLDGAAAIYGADAVAGVVNTVLQTDYDGARVELQYGGAEGTHRREFTGNLLLGRNFDRGNVTLFVNVTDRTSQRAEDEAYTASADLRPLFANDPVYAGLLGADGRATRGPYASLQTVGNTAAVRQGTVALTTAAGAFHTQPTTLTGCGSVIGPGVCIGSGALPTTGAARILRFDTAAGTTVNPAVSRINTFLTGRYDLTDAVEAFGEFGYYFAESTNIQPPVINLNTVTIPASNYYNPFGPVLFANGAVNPNRLPNLVNVPAAGLPVRLTTYRFTDTGFQTVDVENTQLRLLGGVRGEIRGFDWESAVLYSEARATDESDAVNANLLQAQLALSTPDAYNPFNGGCIENPSVGDCTPSSQAAIDAITFKLGRSSRTTLALADLKISRPDLLNLPAGPLGVAFGLEVRRETQKDDRDENLDGTIVFKDIVTGEINPSNVSAVSPNPDTEGERSVGSAYIEFAVPVVSPEMGLPLVRRIDVQLAGRYENYSDFGSVAKPKIAAAWDIVDGLRVRGSYSKGFRAPNLEQTNATQYARLATNDDFVRCEVDRRAGRIASFATCARTNNYSLLISGNTELEPEESTNQSYGVVFEPKFLRDYMGRITFTADKWKIQQEGIVGLFGGSNAVVLDLLLRLQGSSNPNVVRAAPNADDVALFAGSGLTPVGAITAVNDRFVNLLPQEVSGLDLGFFWRLPDTPIGDFDLAVNAARLDTYTRQTGPAVAELFAARAAGTLNAATPLTDASNLVRQNGRPEWKVTTSLTWRKGPVRVGAFTNYITSVEDPGFLSAAGDPYTVDAQLTGNLYGQYDFDRTAGLLNETRIRLGVRNITDEDPPLSPNGYLGSLYNPYGRYFYANLTKRF